MRFLMRNCLKYVQQCQMEFLRKRVGQQQYPIQLCGSPLDIREYKQWKYGESPNT